MPGAQWDSCGFYGEEISKISEKVRLALVVTEAEKAPFVQACFNGHAVSPEPVGQGAPQPPAVPSPRSPLP